MGAVLRPLPPRDPAESHRAATPLELFTDLCYVVAIAIAAAELHHAVSADHIADGVTYFGVSFFAIWWAWLGFAWFNSAYDSDDPLHRVMTFFQVAGSLVLAAGVPDMFHEDFTLVVAGYVIMRFGLVLMWARAAIGHPERRATATTYAVGLTAVQLVWIGATVATDGDLPLWLFVAIGLLDMAVPAVAESRGSTPWHPHHIAERYGLMFIIVLGETVLSSVFAIRSALDLEEVPEELGFVIVGGLLIVFATWWLYFSRDAGEVLTGTSDTGAFAWGFGHYAIFASVAALGAGLAARVDFYDHHSKVDDDVVTAAFVTVPVMAIIATVWLLTIRRHDPSWRTAGPALAAIVVIGALTWVEWTELWVGLVMVVLLVVELAAARRARAVTATP